MKSWFPLNSQRINDYNFSFPRSARKLQDGIAAQKDAEDDRDCLIFNLDTPPKQDRCTI